MELGPKQKEWIQSLKDNPERQLTCSLGKKEPNSPTYQACCLGEYGLICGVIEWELLPRNEYVLRDRNSNSDGYTDNILTFSYEKLGLKNELGWIGDDPDLHNDIEEYIKNNINNTSSVPSIISLAALNDNGFNWPQIAQIIEAFPSAFLTKSI